MVALELLLIRHAHAEDIAASGRDADRALSERGSKRMSESVNGLKRLGFELDVLLSSPWRRALQTAELLRPLLRPELRAEARWPQACQELAEAPGAQLLEVLERVAEATPGLDGAAPRVALVGHEPWMSCLCAGLVTASQAAYGNFAFKKGAVAWLSGRPRLGQMSLQAFLPPKFSRLQYGAAPDSSGSPRTR